MSQTSLTAFESTLQTTNIWLNDIQEQLGWGEDSKHRDGVARRFCRTDWQSVLLEK